LTVISVTVRTLIVGSATFKPFAASLACFFLAAVWLELALPFFWALGCCWPKLLSCRKSSSESYSSYYYFLFGAS
jgi:hypothetical protein